MLRSIILSRVLYALLWRVACTKENTVTENKIHRLQLLPGAWKLRSAAGGFRLPGFAGDFPAGNGTLRIFTDSTYQRFSKGNFYDSGIYKLTSGINPATSSAIDDMLLNRDTTLPFYFHIADDTLTIYVGVIEANGIIDKYVRIKNP